MSILDNLFGTNNDKNINQSSKNETQGKQEGTMQLRKEELDINKDRVNTGEVTLSKEIVEEQETVDVPVMHEEVVIERKCLNNEPCDSQITSSTDMDSDSTCETIHIPVSEEQVNVCKNTVVTGEVSAYKREVEDTKQVNETLKREEARIDKSGNAQVTNNTDTSDSSSDSFQ